MMSTNCSVVRTFNNFVKELYIAMYYKNCTNTVKTFYGVKFQPGDIKRVLGYINSPGFVRAEKPKEPPAEKVEKRKYTRKPKVQEEAKPYSVEPDVVVDSDSIDAEISVHDEIQDNK